MVSSRDVLSAFKPALDGLSSALAMLFGFLNMIFTPVERLFQMVLDFADRGMAFQWVVDLSLALGALVFVFLTKTDDLSSGQFGLAELTARSVVFVASLGLLLVTTSGILGKVFDLSALKDAVGEVKVTFSSEYDAYLATFKHGLHSLLLVATSLLMAVRSDRVTLWATTNATEAPVDDLGAAVSDSGVDTFLWVVFIVLLVSKFFSEGRHGEDAREMKTKQEVIGTTVELDSDHRFKHARGAALTVATGLLVFLVVNSPATVESVTDGVTDVVAQGFFDILASKPIALSLSIYILVVALERIAGRAEWVYGGAGGLVVTGAVSTLNLIFAGWDLAGDQAQPYEEIVVALGVIFLDAMRVGYGQAVPEVGVVSDSRKVFLRLSQAVIGLLLFRYITLTMDTGVYAVRSLLYGVAAASALIKIVGISYIGKDLYKTSTEHHYRELASTGLLLSSAYLWLQSESTEAMIYFVLALFSRFLDSIMDFLMTGKPALSYLTWDKDGEGVDSPTSDNPRTWLTLLGLLASLVFASMVMHDQFEDIKLGANVTDASGAEASRPLDKELSDSMIVAVTFIAVHIAVVIVGLVSEIPGAEAAAVGALSRSKFVRFAVTTTVLCSLAVAMGTFDRDSRTSSDGAYGHLVSALVSYLFADVVGRELL